MSERFFVEQPIASKQIELGGPEAHHLIHVMRAKVEDGVTLFDGSGAEFSGRITKIGRTNVQAEIIERREIDRELSFALTIGVALPKGDRRKWLIEKVVELGATRLVPLQADRSVALPSASTLDRLRRVVIEASKQSGRNCLMKIDTPSATTAFLEASPREARRLLVDPRGASLSTQADPDQAICLAIGPEGGFTDDEFSCAVNLNWEVVSLGPRILRTETAAIAMAAIIAQANRS